MSLPKNLQNLEPRKLAEIEHSRQRRSILQSDERRSDTHDSEKPSDLDELIVDKDKFEYHFSNQKFYSVTAASEKYQYDWLRANCRPGLRVIDFACGNGENGIFAAKCGAEVVGIDISPEGIENARANAKRAEVAERCSFEVMDGENMEFPDDHFDLGVEYGALHHVDLDKALAELARVLKPDGRMICVEALRHNPLIHAYRKRTPHLRTQWEVDHILGVESFDIVKRHFGTLNARYFHLASLAAVPFRKTPIFQPLRKFLDFIDRGLLSVPAIGKYGWITIFEMGKPIKRRSGAA